MYIYTCIPCVWFYYIISDIYIYICMYVCMYVFIFFTHLFQSAEKVSACQTSHSAMVSFLENFGQPKPQKLRCLYVSIWLEKKKRLPSVIHMPIIWQEGLGEPWSHQQELTLCSVSKPACRDQLHQHGTTRVWWCCIENLAASLAWLPVPGCHPWAATVHQCAEDSMQIHIWGQHDSVPHTILQNEPALQPPGMNLSWSECQRRIQKSEYGSLQGNSQQSKLWKQHQKWVSGCICQHGDKESWEVQQEPWSCLAVASTYLLGPEGSQNQQDQQEVASKSCEILHLCLQHALHFLSADESPNEAGDQSPNIQPGDMKTRWHHAVFGIPATHQSLSETMAGKSKQQENWNGAGKRQGLDVVAPNQQLKTTSWTEESTTWLGLKHWHNTNCNHCPRSFQQDESEVASLPSCHEGQSCQVHSQDHSMSCQFAFALALRLSQGLELLTYAGLHLGVVFHCASQDLPNTVVGQAAQKGVGLLGSQWNSKSPRDHAVLGWRGPQAVKANHRLCRLECLDEILAKLFHLLHAQCLLVWRHKALFVMAPPKKGPTAVGLNQAFLEGCLTEGILRSGLMNLQNPVLQFLGHVSYQEDLQRGNAEFALRLLLHLMPLLALCEQLMENGRGFFGHKKDERILLLHLVQGLV